MAWPSPISLNSALFFMAVCVTPWGEERFVSSLFYPSFRRSNSVFVTASLPAIICRLNRTEEPILNPRTFSFWFKSFQTTTRHPHHLLPQSSILFSHEELVLRGWPPRSPRGPGRHVFSLSNSSSPTTFLSTALSLYRHSVCFWLEHVSIFARWLQLVCLVFVIWREWTERVKKQTRDGGRREKKMLGNWRVFHHMKKENRDKGMRNGREI